jgi:CelD/BcsL family acetyltransferase involved in cellulose biosynthesis
MTEFLDIFADRQAVERTWKTLAAVSPHSYFLSWGWIENWLEHLSPGRNVRLAVLWRGDTPVAAGFLGYGRVKRQRVFSSTAYLLNQTGDRTLDQFYIEDNAFLCAPGERIDWSALLHLLPDRWEEIYFAGLNPALPPAVWLNDVPAPYRVLIANRIPAPYVDLRAIAEKGGDYLAAISSNTRSQIRRSYKLYGRIHCTVAADLKTAFEIYDELVDLHQRWWTRRGQRGAFASEYFRGLHRGLIERRFAAGEIQLVRVQNGDSTIGCLYNFDYGGVVSFYQSGLQVETDNRLKPGYVCHTEAIRHNLGLGRHVYDFMASFDDYKLRMSTHQRELVWARIQKPKWKFTAERLLRSAALRMAAHYRKARSGRKRPARLEAAA